MRKTLKLLVDSRCELGEGPLWCPRSGKLYWVDILKSNLWCYDPHSAEAQCRNLPYQVTALGRGSGGSLLLTAKEGFFRYHWKTEQFQPIASFITEPASNRSNDGKCAPDGTFWVGTMNNEGNGFAGSLYSLDGQSTLEHRFGEVGIPNSLAFSPNGKKMYWADSAKQEIYHLPYPPREGALESPQVFASTQGESMVPDGSTVDKDGFLWNAQWDGWRVVRYAQDGSINRIIEVPVQRPTCCAFGGKNLDTLFITSARAELSEEELKQQPMAGGLFALELNPIGVAEPIVAALQLSS